MEFVFVILFVSLIVFGGLQPLLIYYSNILTQPFETLFFRLLKLLSLVNQFKNFAAVFESTTDEQLVCKCIYSMPCQ